MKRARGGFSREVARRFREDRLAMCGLCVVLGLFLVAALADLLANDRPLVAKYKGEIWFPVFSDAPEIRNVDFAASPRSPGDWVLWPPVPYGPTTYDLARRLEPPTRDHLLGTDDRGRDVLARLIHGSRVSLSVGFVAVGVAAVAGVAAGAAAGYWAGTVDMVISRAIEIMICFPTFFLILTVLAFLPPSIFWIMLVIGLTGWPGIARLVRGEFLKLKEVDYVVAARATGARSLSVMLRHMLPNAMAPVLVSATFGVAGAVLTESALSFLGFGVPPPTPSWGDTLSQSRNYIEFAWWLTLFPGAAIFITVTAYNLVGEGLRDAIDPRSARPKWSAVFDPSSLPRAVVRGKGEALASSRSGAPGARP